jgi:hypothetical protein
MRDIHRIERLVLDAIEHTPGPTLTEIVDYIGARRRVWIWTHAGILLAVLRLEGQGEIEARRAANVDGGVRWVYRITDERRNRVPCSTCTGSA